MRKHIFILSILFFLMIGGNPQAASSVFSNPDLPDEFSLVLHDRICPATGWVTANVQIVKFTEGGQSYYRITSVEGSLFRTVTVVHAQDLTTASEKRYNAQSDECIEYFENNNGAIAFYNQEKSIDKKSMAAGRNVYSRYSYFISFMGFPFELKKEVAFKSYMFEYGDALTMKLVNKGKQMVSVKAGRTECYKLELSVSGWQSIVSRDKYYFYFMSEKPHYFVKFEQKEADGEWYSNELIRVTEIKKKQTNKETNKEFRILRKYS